MKPNELILRCYVEKQGNLWIAACIDLCLAAQDYEPGAAIDRLHLQIVDHVNFAFQNEELTHQMLSRKAPLSFIFKYHKIRLKNAITSYLQSKAQESEKAFFEAMPLMPAC